MPQVKYRLCLCRPETFSSGFLHINYSNTYIVHIIYIYKLLCKEIICNFIFFLQHISFLYLAKVYQGSGSSFILNWILCHSVQCNEKASDVKSLVKASALKLEMLCLPQSP